MVIVSIFAFELCIMYKSVQFVLKYCKTHRNKGMLLCHDYCFSQLLFIVKITQYQLLSKKFHDY